MEEKTGDGVTIPITVGIIRQFEKHRPDNFLKSLGKRIERTARYLQKTYEPYATVQLHHVYIERESNSSALLNLEVYFEDKTTLGRFKLVRPEDWSKLKDYAKRRIDTNDEFRMMRLVSTANMGEYSIYEYSAFLQLGEKF